MLEPKKTATLQQAKLISSECKHSMLVPDAVFAEKPAGKASSLARH